jgi:hypothetical protein
MRIKYRTALNMAAGTRASTILMAATSRGPVVQRV